ncbi:MAG: anti-sigma F factor [Clostridiales bacterium]|jgi:stage II sporulation protein AB (anti-sigma F factor)|nr:anti-sigma F factor [Clostridiales bacterium]
MYENEMTLRMSARSENESFARVAAAAFAAQLDPTVAEIQEIKTAVSEAVTNAVIHGYEGLAPGEITLTVKLRDKEVYIEIADGGRGIADVEAAKQPLYTSRPDLERSGMGFTVMETFMDDVRVFSEQGKGTKIMMTKKLS